MTLGNGSSSFHETVTKGWISGLLYIAVTFAASGFAAATYIRPNILTPTPSGSFPPKAAIS